jgi:hypothetical protein
MQAEENKKQYIDTSDKIIVEDLIKDFKILNIDTFNAYLLHIWKVNLTLKFK